MIKLICCLVSVFSLCEESLPKSDLLEVEQNPSQFEVWLGKQTNSKSYGTLFRPFRSTVDSSGSNGSDWRWEGAKETLDIQLRIVVGSKVRRVSRADEGKVYQELPQTKNGYTTLINGEVGSVQEQSELRIRHNSFYVVGVVSQTNGSHRYYSLNARITDGPLKNAVVHLRDDTIPRAPSGKDPYVAVYKVPEYIEVTEGDLDFQIIRLFRK